MAPRGRTQQVLARLAAGVTPVDVAIEFNITPQAVYQLRKKWASDSPARANNAGVDRAVEGPEDVAPPVTLSIPSPGPEASPALSESRTTAPSMGTVSSSPPDRHGAQGEPATRPSSSSLHRSETAARRPLFPESASTALSGVVPAARPDPVHAALEAVAARQYVADEAGLCRDDDCTRTDVHHAGKCAAAAAVEPVISSTWLVDDVSRRVSCLKPPRSRAAHPGG